MKTLFRPFSRAAHQPIFRRRHFMSAVFGTVWLAVLLLQLLLPVIKTEAATTDTIPLVRSNPSIQCFGQITVDAQYAQVGVPVHDFDQAYNSPPGDAGIAYGSTMQAVDAGQPLPYIFFSNDNTASQNACYFAGMLFQSPLPGQNNNFYGFVYDDADGSRRSPIPVAAIGTVDPATKVINFTSQAYPGGNINSVSYSLKVRDPDNKFVSAYFPSLASSGGGGGSTSTGPCAIFSLPATISQCQQNPDPRFVDIATIRYRGEYYTTSHWGGSTIKYFLSSTFEPNRKTFNIDKGDACRPYISISADKSNGEGLDINLDDNTLGSLQDIEKSLAEADAKGSVDANYTDFNYACAKTVDNQGGYKVGDPIQARFWGAYYDKTKTVNLYFTDGEKNESPYLSVYKTQDYKTFAGTNLAGCEQAAPHFDFGQALNALGTGTTASVSGDWYLNTPNPCEQYAKIGVFIRIAPKDQDPPAIKSNAANNPSATVHVDCEWSFNPLTWIMCPLLDATQGIINTVGSFIKDQLDINASIYFDKTNETGIKIYQAWNSVRLISMTLLVVIALVMVIAQALSIEVIDAYTVKKVLPRLVVAIIAISLSWEITRLLVVFSNDLAKAVQTIILAPFDSLGNPTLNGAQITAIGGGFAVVGIAFLLTIFAAAALALLLAFIAIVLRQMIVIFLVIVSPIAILASILPNTQKLWKIWHETFNGALLVYSIIVGFIALGAAFGKVADKSGTPAAPFIALIATYIPYFLIPKAFTLATGLIGTLGGAVNDRSKGAFDKLRKRRGEIMKDRYARAKNEKLWNPNNALVRATRANKLATWAAAPHKNLAYSARHTRLPFLGAAGRQLEHGIHEASMEQTGKLFQKVNNIIGDNDKAYRAAGGLHRGLSASTRAKLKEAKLLDRAWTSENDIRRGAQIMASSDSATERLAAEPLLSSAPLLAGLYRDADMNYANVRGAHLLGLASHGFADGDDLADAGNALAGETSRGFAHSMLVQAQLAGARSRPDIKAGYGFTIDENGNFVNGMTEGGRDFDLLETLGQGDIAGAKGGFLGSMGGSIKEAITTGNSAEAEAAYEATKDISGEQKEALRGTSEGRATLRLAQAHRLAKPLEDELIQAASRYSQAPMDTKARANTLIGEIPGLRERVAAYEAQIAQSVALGGAPGDTPEPHVPPGAGGEG